MCWQRLVLTGLVFCAATYCASESQADSISIANPTAFPSPVNLSAAGQDWAHWAQPNNPGGGEVSMVFDHAATTSFSNVSGVNGTLSGWSTPGVGDPEMTWAGGVPDSTGDSQSWVFNTNSVVNSGLQFTYNAAPGATVIDVYVNAYTGITNSPLPVEMQAALSSGVTATNTTNLPVFWAPTEQDGVYAISVVNSSTSTEGLTLTFSQTSAVNYSNVGLFGASAAPAVSAVPLPSAVYAGGTLFGCVGLLRFRRRRMATIG
jgi:hypothetical protein